ncbi:class I SAM-dependent methyltransferase [uncultured Jatrophihabitans sp.]|uniref:class I SAM-dependent methyltransferase n=1 Tax=uncultured Jatrophihabitans sp. TaxID=1610747 RepID=UPI0035CA83C0
MTSSTPYPAAHYATQVNAARASADAVAGMVMSLLAPTSVLDVGCGAGAWLAAFRDLGATDVYGIEGGHPDPAQLQVRPEQIRALNLEREFDLGRRFDLAVTVEVAEHLPARSADGFVRSLTRHADAVLFSAAVPEQGGDWHLNEQWPDYWYSRFAEHGFACFDVLRRQVWNDPDVDWWYRQNVLLYATGAAADRLHAAGASAEPAAPLPLIHPELFWQARRQAERDLGLRETLRMFPRAVRNRVAQARAARGR